MTTKKKLDVGLTVLPEEEKKVSKMDLQQEQLVAILDAVKALAKEVGELKTQLNLKNRSGLFTPKADPTAAGPKNPGGMTNV